MSVRPILFLCVCWSAGLRWPRHTLWSAGPFRWNYDLCIQVSVHPILIGHGRCRVGRRTLPGRPASGGQRTRIKIGVIQINYRCRRFIQVSARPIPAVAGVVAGLSGSGSRRILWSVGLWPGVWPGLVRFMYQVSVRPILILCLVGRPPVGTHTLWSAGPFRWIHDLCIQVSVCPLLIGHGLVHRPPVVDVHSDRPASGPAFSCGFKNSSLKCQKQVIQSFL